MDQLGLQYRKYSKENFRQVLEEILKSKRYHKLFGFFFIDFYEPNAIKSVLY